MTGDPASPEVLERALGTLVQYLFPNGYPSGWNTQNAAETATATALWLFQREQQTRALVSSEEAGKSLKILQRHSHRRGLSSDQQQAMVMATCATLDPTALSSVNLLVCGGDKAAPKNDGENNHNNNSRLFRDLIQMILPQKGHPISGVVVLKLLSTCQKYGDNNMVVSTVLQFLALAVRKGALTNEARRTLASMHSLLFHYVMQPSLCMDAVRLLLTITQRNHARLYRASRLIQQWRHENVAGRSEPLSPNQWPILLLLQLYAQLDPQGCGHVFSRLKLKGRDLKAYARRLAFPNPRWERTFHRVWHPANTNNDNKEPPNLDHYLPQSLLSLEDDSDANANPTQASLQQEKERYRICLPFVLQQEWYGSHPPTSKKRGMPLQDETTDTEPSRDDVHGGGDDLTTVPPAASWARLEATQQTKVESTEARARRRILDALTVGSLYNMDPARDATLAFSRDLLPAWDGTEEWGVTLCYDILPVLASTSSFAGLWSKRLVFLERLFWNGTPKLRYAIVSGILAPLLSQLARRGANDAGRRSVKEFIHWAQQLLQESLISRSAWDCSLLSEAAMNFFHVVGTDVAQNCSLLVLPNPTWAHRFLLSTSPFATDRGWQLLVVYVTSLKALTARQGGRDGASGNIIVDGLDRYVRIGWCYVSCALTSDQPDRTLAGLQFSTAWCWISVSLSTSLL